MNDISDKIVLLITSGNKLIYFTAILYPVSFTVIIKTSQNAVKSAVMFDLPPVKVGAFYASIIKTHSNAIDVL